MVVAQPGLVIRRTKHWNARLDKVIPPRSTGVHAVLDIVNISASIDDAGAIIAEACQSGRIKAAAIAAALEERVGLRYRRELRPISTMLRQDRTRCWSSATCATSSAATDYRPARGNAASTASSQMSPTRISA